MNNEKEGVCNRCFVNCNCVYIDESGIILEKKLSQYRGAEKRRENAKWYCSTCLEDTPQNRLRNYHGQVSGHELHNEEEHCSYSHLIENMQQLCNTEGQKVNGERLALDTRIKIGKRFDIDLLHDVTLQVHCLGLLKQKGAKLRRSSQSADVRLEFFLELPQLPTTFSDTFAEYSESEEV